jgi:hypothetical protein
MPGISPSFAISRKQMRHKLKSLIYPRFLPHLKQRRTTRLEYFGFFLLRAMTDVFAMLVSFFSVDRTSKTRSARTEVEEKAKARKSFTEEA